MSLKSKNNAFKMILSWKQRCSIFDIHSNIHPFRDKFYKEILIFFFFTLLLTAIVIKPHIKTPISSTCYSKNSSNY